jgi:glutaredoxin
MPDGRAHPSSPLGGVRRTLLAAALTLGALPVQALYKVVGPDGRVTYTDRPPSGAPAVPVAPPDTARQATPGSTPEAAASDTLAADARTIASWSLALRQAATKFPVTLYTAAGCAPCEEARRLLQQRGVPYHERLVRTEEDARRLEQLTGARLVPAARVGRQALSGLQEQDWQGWLDTAGYPRTRVLPSSWQPAPAVPLTPPGGLAGASSTVSAPSAAASAAKLRPAPALPAADPRPGPAGIRF